MARPGAARVAWLVVAAAAVLCAAGVRAAATTVATSPDLPLLDVAFCATAPPSASGGTLFVSRKNDCSDSLAEVLTSGTCSTAGSFAFNVTSASLVGNLETPVQAVPKTFWCVRSSGGSVTNVGTLQMNVVQTSPMYYTRSTDSTLAFNTATPVDTTIGFSILPDCTSPLPNSPQFTVDLKRSVVLNTNAATVYICASISSVVTGGPGGAMALRNTIVGGTAYTITPTEGVRHSTVTIATGQGGIVYYALSTSSKCSDLPVPTVSQPNNNGQLSLTVKKTFGTYYFCRAASDGVYMPASNTFSVVEYGVQPHTTYAGQQTVLSLSLNASSSGMQQMALFASQSCSGDAVQDWGERSWTVNTAGTYYACVRRNESSAVYYANQFIVTEMPKLTSKPTDAVSGFSLTVSIGGSLLSGASYTIALFANNGCSGLLATAQLPAGTTSAILQVPVGTADTTYYYCLMNPKAVMNAADTSEETTVDYYNAGSVAARPFRLGYDALRAGRETSFTLDTAVSLSAGTAVSFVPTTATAPVSNVCGAATGSSGVREVVTQVTSGNTLTGVTFPRAGMWAACAKVSGAYTLLRRVTVYSAAASLTRTTLLASAAASVTVSDVPAGAAVTIVSGSACGPSPLTSGTSSDAGTVTLSVAAPTAGTASVCVAYPGASATSASPPAPLVLKAASLTVVQPLSYPSIAFTNGTTTLRFTGVGDASLQDYTMKLVTTEDCRPAGLSSPVVSVPLSRPSSDVAGAWGASVSGSALDSTQTYAVCVGMSSSTAYSMAGTVTAVAMPDAQADTSTRSSVAVGLPAHVALPVDFVVTTGVDTYAVVSGATDCTAGVASVIAKGSIDAATGTTGAFVPDVAGATLTVCVVAQKHLLGGGTLGYVRAMPLSVVPFGTSTTQVQVNRTNDVGGEPLSLIPGTQLLLAACSGSACSSASATATCHDSQAMIPAASVLPDSVSTYVVCQRVQLSGETYMVGSSTSVQAVAPYVLSLDAPLLRVYVPASVTLRGGPASGLSGTYTVVVQPASVDCSTTTTTSQRFDVKDGSGSVTVTAVSPGQDVVFCLADTSLGNRTLLRAHLTYYMWPIAVIAGRATTVTSGSTASGLSAKLSSTSQCNDVVAGGGEQALVSGAAAFTVYGCDGTTSGLATVYYCEKSSSSSTWASRGPMGLLRASNCSGGEAASIGMVYAAPGTALTSYGIGPSAYLTAPRLSATAACTSLVDAGVGTVGYAPAMDESAVFYVCAQVVGDATLMFTTTVPTLTVRNWAVLPRAALSRYNATMGTQPSPSLSLNYAAPSANTFLSTAQDCGASLAAASGLAATGGVVVYRTVGVSGLVYVCTTNPLTSQTVAVAAFLSVTPPSVTQAAPAIVRDSTYTATLVVLGPSPLYSMQKDADGEFAYHSYYTFDDRSVYLSVDGCASELADTTKINVDLNDRVSFVMESIALGVSSVTLCTGTAAGVAETLSVSVAPGVVYPTRLVSGVSDAPTYMPAYPSTAFQLSRSNGDCSARAGMPTFTTDSQGYGTVGLLDEHGAALAVGTYTLCTGGTAAGVRAAAALADGDVTAVETVELVTASHFAVRGTTFVVGVPGTMELMQDLRSSYLLDGLSTTANCTSMTTAYGSWSTVSDTTVSVNATAESASPLYMCAVAPVNASSIALPGGASSVVFAASSIALPPGGWDACSRYTLDRCVAPGSGTASSSSSDVLAMVHGDCCSSTRGVVGESDMSGATCRLSLDYAAVASYGSGATFNLCVLRRDDASVCTTVASGVSVSTACTPASSKGRLSGGAIAGIVVGCVVGGLLLIALVVLLWWCCFRKKSKEEESDEDAFSDDRQNGSERAVRMRRRSTGGSGGARNVLAPRRGGSSCGNDDTKDTSLVADRRRESGDSGAVAPYFSLDGTPPAARAAAQSSRRSRSRGGNGAEMLTGREERAAEVEGVESVPWRDRVTGQLGRFKRWLRGMNRRVAAFARKDSSSGDVSADSTPRNVDAEVRPERGASRELPEQVASRELPEQVASRELPLQRIASVASVPTPQYRVPDIPKSTAAGALAILALVEPVPPFTPLLTRLPGRYGSADLSRMLVPYGVGAYYDIDVAASTQTPAAPPRTFSICEPEEYAKVIDLAMELPRKVQVRQVSDTGFRGMYYGSDRDVVLNWCPKEGPYTMDSPPDTPVRPPRSKPRRSYRIAIVSAFLMLEAMERQEIEERCNFYTAYLVARFARHSESTNPHNIGRRACKVLLSSWAEERDGFYDEFDFMKRANIIAQYVLLGYPAAPPNFINEVRAATRTGGRRYFSSAAPMYEEYDSPETSTDEESGSGSVPSGQRYMRVPLLPGHPDATSTDSTTTSNHSAHTPASARGSNNASSGGSPLRRFEETYGRIGLDLRALVALARPPEPVLTAVEFVPHQAATPPEPEKPAPLQRVATQVAIPQYRSRDFDTAEIGAAGVPLYKPLPHVNGPSLGEHVMRVLDGLFVQDCKDPDDGGVKKPLPVAVGIKGPLTTHLVIDEVYTHLFTTIVDDDNARLGDFARSVRHSLRKLNLLPMGSATEHVAKGNARLDYLLRLCYELKVTEVMYLQSGVSRAIAKYICAGEMLFMPVQLPPGLRQIAEVSQPHGADGDYDVTPRSLPSIDAATPSRDAVPVLTDSCYGFGDGGGISDYLPPVAEEYPLLPDDLPPPPPPPPRQQQPPPLPAPPRREFPAQPLRQQQPPPLPAPPRRESPAQPWSALDITGQSASLDFSNYDDFL